MRLRPRGLSEAEVFAWFMPGEPPPADQCWDWTASVNHPGGGGQFAMYVDGRQSMRAAHRAAYSIYRGPIPAGMKVLQSCKRRICCQPAHLYLHKPTRKRREPKLRLTAEERFWRRVDKEGPLNVLVGGRCWLWRNNNVHWDGSPTVGAESPEFNGVSALRFSYELATGEKIPPDVRLVRRCQNRRCVNPDHLTLTYRPVPNNGVSANERRRRDAAERRIASAVAAIPAILAANDIDADRYLAVVGARIQHPHASLTELGEHLGMTKDSYAAALRRATTLADRRN